MVVMLHGYYGTAEDWARFFPLVPDHVVAASLQAPVPLDDRWSWVDLAPHGVAGVTAVGRGFLAWLDTLPAAPVALLGWSQGAATSVHLLRSEPERIVAVAALGGFLWETRPHRGVARRRPVVFAGWGERENVVTPSQHRRARTWLETHCDTTFRSYPDVGHELTADAEGRRKRSHPSVR
ncbi:alpha/beta fold hydrolase [Georgenia phoenicis]|uniref:alpha/beta hydrolase n=1 Tax=unclassified Georgenia TaxID=2626815 RepID=UPI0039AFD50F